MRNIILPFSIVDVVVGIFVGIYSFVLAENFQFVIHLVQRLACAMVLFTIVVIVYVYAWAPLVFAVSKQVGIISSAIVSMLAYLYLFYVLTLYQPLPIVADHMVFFVFGVVLFTLWGPGFCSRLRKIDSLRRYQNEILFRTSNMHADEKLTFGSYARCGVVLLLVAVSPGASLAFRGLL